MLVAIDTGILIRVVNRTDPQHTDVRAAVRTVHDRGDTMVTALQNMAEFWNVCTRPDTARDGYGLSVAGTARKARILERWFAILPDLTDTYQTWRRLVETHEVKGVQVHDARLVAWMTGHGISDILTLNARDFTRYPDIRPCTPAEVLAPPETTTEP